MEDRLYWYWLANIKGIGTATQRKLLSICPEPRRLFSMDNRSFAPLLTDKQMEAFTASRKIEKIKREYDELCRRGIVFLTERDGEYPDSLRALKNAPVALYRKGNPVPDGKKVAVVGARNCTVQGQTIAKYFGKELARAGVCVVSGMALGIDGAAHRGALDARMETGNPEQAGGTIGVLGCGINVRYPLEHYHLFDEMEANGTLLSEYNWNVRPNRGFFPARNQIMSAMCDAILVVEARRRSGSLITADMGLEQGKDIFAVPGRITDELSVGCNRLIQQGASVATCPAEILAQLGIRTEPADESGTKTDAKNFSLETDEKLVYSCLDFEPKYVDSIIRETGLSVQTVLSILYQLESRRCVRQVVNNYYAKTESELR